LEHWKKWIFFISHSTSLDSKKSSLKGLLLDILVL
jgi:hypothetical protein